jgi:hypothetical protein
MAFGIALYIFLIVNFIFSALLGSARRVYPIYEVQFSAQAPFQRGRRLVWTIVSALFLGIVSSILASRIVSLM